MNRKERGVAARPDARVLHGRGQSAMQQGRPEDAIAHFSQALAMLPTNPAVHHGLAEAYRALGRPVEAERHYRRVAELQPGGVTLLHLGNALMELQRPADAAQAYQAALRRDDRLVEIYYGLGTALAALGRIKAADAFAGAIALRPDFALAHEGLIDSLIAADAWELALRTSCDGLRQVDTPRLRVQFVDCVTNAPLAPDIAGLPGILHRALREGWTRPQDLVRPVCELAAFRQPFDPGDALLHAVLHLAPICHRGVEQALCEARQTLLQVAASGRALDAGELALACALARQCFINEYAWDCRQADRSAAGAVRGVIGAALDRGLAPSQDMIAASAMVVPLSSLEGAERLLSHPATPEIAALLAQQISEPAEEQRLRGTIPRATAIEDAVSRAVRDQYEENPYPRWVAMAGPVARIRLGEWLAARFPGAPIERLPGDVALEMLVAGCGTGQQALETMRTMADMRVLAIDLSLSSLAYAARMTAALGVDGIAYAQADLLDAAGLGRSFDVIGAGGVLHHMADPWTGWGRLLALLRPGGMMNVLLYTVRGREDVRRARDWIAARGHAADPESIRRCRRELMALPDDWAVLLSASPDSCSTSGCRDLLFHVHERAVTLPEVSDFLAAEGVTLIGVEVPPTTERAFEAWCGGVSDAALRDLARWDEFEAEHPRCFAAMLNLWVQKPS